jgi:hypothetical protein
MKKLLFASFLVIAASLCFALKEGKTAANGANVGANVSTTSALAANLVLRTICPISQCVLTSFEVSADSTLSAAAWWIMIYDATAAPSDGAVTPKKCYAIASGTTSFAAAFQTPPIFTTGIVIGVSTTGCFSKTASAHAFISGDTL